MADVDPVTAAAVESTFAGTCDWGDCDEPVAVLRLDRHGHGWLPCCARCAAVPDGLEPSVTRTREDVLRELRAEAAER